MTNLTRLRLILVDLSGLMKKKTYLKQNVLFFKNKIFHNLLSVSNTIDKKLTHSVTRTNFPQLRAAIRGAGRNDRSSGDESGGEQ